VIYTILFSYIINMLDNVRGMLQPDFSKSYCDYFYYLMVIYMIIGTLTVADIIMSGLSNVKNLKGFLKSTLPSKAIQLISICVHFFVLRLLYSMCANSLPASKEGMYGGEEGEMDATDGMTGMQGGSSVEHMIAAAGGSLESMMGGQEDDAI
jgi:hypothetical protein